MADRDKYLERQKKYNQSRKGQARNKRYEDKHPERRVRWEQARNAIRPRNGWLWSCRVSSKACGGTPK